MFLKRTGKHLRSGYPKESKILANMNPYRKFSFSLSCVKFNAQRVPVHLWTDTEDLLSCMLSCMFGFNITHFFCI